MRLGLSVVDSSGVLVSWDPNVQILLTVLQ